MEAYKTEEGRYLVRQAVRLSYKACPVETESLTVDSERFGETHILAAGEKSSPPVVLLHGSSGNSTAWFGIVGHLSPEYRVYMIDLPGQPGLSDSRRPGLENGELTQWLAEVLDSLEIEAVYLAGISLGAWLALDLAVHCPDKAAAVALISPSGIMPPKKGFFFRILPLAFMGRYGQKQIFRLIHGPVPIVPEMLDFAMLVSRHYKPMTRTPPVFNDSDLSSITTALQFLGGERDVMLDMPGSAWRLGALVPHAQVTLRKGYSHVLPDERKTLKAFFRSA